MKPNFTLSHFKKWMGEQKGYTDHQKKLHHIIGTKVEAKVPSCKLVQVSSTEEGDLTELIVSFQESGGVVTDIDGKNFLVEVDIGTFYVPRQYVRPA